MKTLDLTMFPLDSLSLVEASAGTGKTYALANLYLRYLLERKFTVDQILVVTFTEAATQELKDRIRVRIQALRLAFEKVQESVHEGTHQDEAEKDPILLHLIAQSSSPEKDILTLRLAERQIDQAQIHTIHGFCQQILKRHALDSNVPLKQLLLEDETQLRQRVLEDYWRRYVLSLPTTALECIVKKWSEPDALQAELSTLLNRSPSAIIPAPSGCDLVHWQDQFKVYQSWFEDLQTATLSMIDAVEAVLLETPLKANKTKLKWLSQMKHWALSDTLSFSLPKTGKDTLFERFTSSRVMSETPKGKETPSHAYFDFLERHFEQPLPDINALFIAQSYQIVNTLMTEAKLQQSVFSFDDLISRVSQALSSQDVDKNKTLSSMIGAPYQVALIDEFQDTDPEQYAIFNRLFGTESPKQTPRLVLIGDPKQAIYGFRGGDIATYLSAKHAIASHENGQIFTMDTNWRSSPAMVNVVNALFNSAPNAFMAEDIPFQTVKAAKKAPEGLPEHALFISQFEVEQSSKSQIVDALALQCVQQIQQLISQSSALSLEDDKALQHSDIAVLVRSSKEGEVIKNALAAIGLRATLDSQESIYASEEAHALYFLLAAAAEPGDEAAMRRCLAEPFFGVSDQQLFAFNEQAAVFAHYSGLFEQLHQKWLKSGVLAMIRDALKILGVFDFWHKDQHDDNEARPWERRLTNWNQLAEILQKQSRQLTSHFSVLRWYHDTLSGVMSGRHSAKGDNETKLRLESDAELIRIITIHKSKGLEYPFVFMPFLFSCRGATEAWFYNDAGQLSIDLSKAESNLASAEKERLAEDVRLLYVALTRAKYQCYIGTAAYKSNKAQSYGLAKTAWARLLFRADVPKDIDNDVLKTQLESLQSGCPELVQLDFISPDAASHLSLDFSERSDEPRIKRSLAPLTQHQLKRAIYDDWRVQSFTGLMNESHRLKRLDHRSSGLDHRPKKSTSPVNPNEITIFNFPKGSQAGTFLHTLFEHLDFEHGVLERKAAMQYVSLNQFIHTKLSLTRLVDDKFLEAWANYLEGWVHSVLASPLAFNIKLADLNGSAYFSEMQFYFSVKHYQSVRFNALLQTYLGTQSDIDFSSFEGHLKGAIDLVFEANEQFYILDYKSNYLGDSALDYQTESLACAMEEHRYDVQYVIYTLALHRFLKQRRKANYLYERDMGGVIYLFLRGLTMSQQAAVSERALPTGVYFIKPPTALILALDEAVGQ